MKDADPRVIQQGRKASEDLLARLYPILLERRKEEVLKDKLPKKDERVVFCELSPLQVSF
jgi:SNF2 family DNA or RNA helicase